MQNKFIDHTTRCDQDRRRRLAWEKLYPHFCRTCQGYGILSYSENQSPFGSGYVWNQEITEPCTDCVGMGKCPAAAARSIPIGGSTWSQRSTSKRTGGKTGASGG